MNKKVNKSLLVLFYLVFTSSTINGQDSFEVSKVIDVAKKAIVLGQEKVLSVCNEETLPPLKNVEITFEGITTKEVGGKIKIFVFSFGKKITKEKTQKMILTLKPPKDNTFEASSSVVEQLTSLIVAATEGACLSGNQDLSLMLSNLVVQLNFVVQKSNSAGLEFEITPVSTELSGDLSTRAVHTIKIEFGKED